MRKNSTIQKYASDNAEKQTENQLTLNGEETKTVIFGNKTKSIKKKTSLAPKNSLKNKRKASMFQIVEHIPGFKSIFS